MQQGAYEQFDNVWISFIIQQENPRKLLIFNEASIL